MTALRPWHRLSIHLALVGLVVASALVAVGAHEHDIWRGDAPESVTCVVDHEPLAEGVQAQAAGAERSGAPVLRAAERAHRHVCFGLHGTAPPPAVYPDPTPQRFDAAAQSLPFVAASPAEQGADLALPGPRGPPAL